MGYIIEVSPPPFLYSPVLQPSLFLFSRHYLRRPVFGPVLQAPLGPSPNISCYSSYPACVHVIVNITAQLGVRRQQHKCSILTPCQNSNTLKRRRPFGHEPESPEVLFHQGGATAYPSVDLGFASLPPDHRDHLDQVAFFYGLNAFQLHSLLYNYATSGSSEEPNLQSPKKPRISPSYPMAPPSSANGLDRSDPNRIPQHGLEAGGPGANFNGSYPLELDGASRLTTSLANLKVVLCQNCLTRCDGQDSTSSC